MKRFDLIFYVYWNTLIYLVISHSILFPALQPLKREIRFSKHELKVLIPRYATILDSSINHYGIKQYFNTHFIVKENLTDFSITYSVEKCKEYYIDCVNVVSYDIFDACSKLIFISYFNMIGTSEYHVKKCPIYGEYKYTNVSMNLDTFMSSFSNPTEKWWEYYWKTNLSIINKINQKIGYGTVHFYIIQYRPQKH